VSEGLGGFHDFQPSRFNDIASAPLCCHSTINASVQNSELVRNQSFRLSGPPGRLKSGNCSYLNIERCCWDRKQKGGDEIEGIDLLEAIGNRPVSSGSKAYLT